MSDQFPPAGWYPAPHANNEQRYWDGAQWLEPTPVPAVSDHTATAIYSATDTDQVEPKKSHRGWIIGGSIAAGVLVLGGIGSALGLGGDVPTVEPESTITPWSTPIADEIDTSEEEPAVFIEVPDVAGMTVADAIAAFADLDLVIPDISTFEDPTALVISTSPQAGYEVEEGRAVEFTVEEKPKFTLAQENAINKAQDYLSFMGFSRTGLITQLEFEGFSTEEATFGADNAGADWNDEAAQKAQEYLDTMAFSRAGLYDQMAFEGFTHEQIEFGLAAVGY